MWQVGGKAHGIDHLPSNRAWLSPLCHNYYSSPQSTQDIAHTLKLMTKPRHTNPVSFRLGTCVLNSTKKHVTVHDTTRKQLSTGVKDMKPCSTHGKENGYCINWWAGCVCVCWETTESHHTVEGTCYISTEVHLGKEKLARTTRTTCLDWRLVAREYSSCPLEGGEVATTGNFVRCWSP